VARDRQRAKQRKARRAQNPGPAPSKLNRADLPGELEHASGEVDEFEAALISGAEGEPEAAFGEEEDPDAARRAFGDEHEVTPEELDDEEFDALEDEVDDATLEEQAVEAAPRARREAAAPGAPTRKGAGRFVGFLQASWAELQRVQWPDRRQVAQATGVVIGFVIIAGLYLGVADWVAKQIVQAII
jgi:preprotein translocase SecE subunit